MGKEEIARDEQFLLFLQCFLLNLITVSPFVHIFDIISLFAAESEEFKIGISGKGPNIATNMHTMLQVIPIYDDKVMHRRSKKCYKNEYHKRE